MRNPLAPESRITMTRILAQRRQRRGMHRHQAILAKLGLPDVENSVDEIDVGTIQAERFAGSQARARQSPTSIVNTCALGISRRNIRHAAMSDASSLVAQDARRWNGAGSGKGARIERFGSRIVDGEILTKAAEDPVTDGAAVGGSPGERTKSSAAFW